MPFKGSVHAAKASESTETYDRDQEEEIAMLVESRETNIPHGNDVISADVHL